MNSSNDDGYDEIFSRSLFFILDSEFDNDPVSVQPFVYKKNKMFSIKKTYFPMPPPPLASKNNFLNRKIINRSKLYYSYKPKSAPIKCPMCPQTFYTQEFLGEHFIATHNNYEDLSKLDNNKNKGFPGFKLLIYIGMLSKIKKSEREKIMEKNKSCSICYQNYKIKTKEIISIPNDDFGYNSDSEIHLPSSIKKSSSCDDLKEEEFISIKKSRSNKKIHRNINDSKLVKFINEYNITEKIPIKLNCCNETICKTCIKEHLSITNSLICPFCMKDHTQEHTDYIKIIDLSDNIDPKRWREWWIRHLDIFF